MFLVFHTWSTGNRCSLAWPNIISINNLHTHFSTQVTLNRGVDNEGGEGSRDGCGGPHSVCASDLPDHPPCKQHNMD